MSDVNGEKASSEAFASRFASYFQRPVAVKAAEPLNRKAQIQLRIGADESFYFTKASGTAEIQLGDAPDADIEFRLTPTAAEAVLAETSEDIGAIGVGIAKLIASPDPERRIQLRLRTGFLTLFSKGYLGVITAGGGPFAAFLASKGLGSLSAIKDVIAKLRASG